jgi:hypothetical protein
MFSREMSWWAPWAGLLAQCRQEWLISFPNNPVREGATCFHAGSCWAGDGGDMFLRNVG